MDLEQFRRHADGAELVLDAWRGLMRRFANRWAGVMRDAPSTLVDFSTWVRSDEFQPSYQHAIEVRGRMIEFEEWDEFFNLVVEYNPDSVDIEWLPVGLAGVRNSHPSSAYAAIPEYSRAADWLVARHIDPQMIPITYACPSLIEWEIGQLPDGLEISKGAKRERSGVVRALTNADKQNISGGRKSPRNRDVNELCEYLRKHANDGRSENSKSREFCNLQRINPNRAEGLLRQARRYRDLWK